jgi:hypothetical protein
VERKVREVKINGMKLVPNQDAKYKYNYWEAAERIARGEWDELSTYRKFILNDLFFIVYFILRIPGANHPFVVQACRDVETGPKSKTLDLWAREHYKTSVITISEALQKIVTNPNSRIAYFSHTKPIALNFLRSVKAVLEGSELLKACFPDELYENPQSQAEKWSEEAGLFVRRSSFAKEPTLAAFGLVEGMPTSMHFTDAYYDDVETPDLTYTPEIIEKLISSFEMSLNLGTDDGSHRVIGTPYSHAGLLMYLKAKKGTDGKPLYHLRTKPATHDGTASGSPVLLSPPRLEDLRASPHFFSQQLLDPTPQGERRLVSKYLKTIKIDEIPKKLFKCMTIDPAGERRADKRQGDSWAIMVLGVEPYMDDLGASRVFILDAVIEPMTEAEAMSAIVAMYLRNGQILKVGVEKVAMTTAEIHVSNALRAKGIYVTLDNKRLVLLRPAGREKAQRIEAAISWPLNNGKIHISEGVPSAYRDRVVLEMDKFPVWHDDALDALAYGYDLIKDFRFGFFRQPEAEAKSVWDRYKKKARAEYSSNNWLAA